MIINPLHNRKLKCRNGKFLNNFFLIGKFQKNIRSPPDICRLFDAIVDKVRNYFD